MSQHPVPSDDPPLCIAKSLIVRLLPIAATPTLYVVLVSNVPTAVPADPISVQTLAVGNVVDNKISVPRGVPAIFSCKP